MHVQIFQIFSVRNKGRKEDCVNSHESAWETTVIVSGKLPLSFRNITSFCKVKIQCSNENLKSLLFYSMNNEKSRNTTSYYPLMSNDLPFTQLTNQIKPRLVRQRERAVVNMQ